MDRRLVRQSKKLSRLLRHRGPDVGLRMDPAGWVEVDELLGHLQITRGDLEEVVRLNDKQRLQLLGSRIRCCQGHSLDCRAVTREALEASWSRYEGGDSVWHGTRVEVVEAIARDGILAQNRTHVHLAPATDSVVGKRAAVAVLLEVSCARLRERGHEVFTAPNGVILTRHVPAACVVGLRTLSDDARARARVLRRTLGLG